MALRSFMANCFKYLWVSKMKPICIPQIFYEDSEFINHSRQKTSFICFFLFETSKFWNCWPFYPTGGVSSMHTFEKRQCDTCQHRSAVKNTPPPSPSLPVPIPPPTEPTTPAPTAQGQWYRAFWIMGFLRPMAVAPLAHSIGNPFGSVRPHPPPPAQSGNSVSRWPWSPQNNSKQAI